VGELYHCNRKVAIAGAGFIYELTSGAIVQFDWKHMTYDYLNDDQTMTRNENYLTDSVQLFLPPRALSRLWFLR
jgi:hypothetical protein